MNTYISNIMKQYENLDKSTILTVPENPINWEDADCPETLAALNLEDTRNIITQRDRDDLIK